MRSSTKIDQRSASIDSRGVGVDLNDDLVEFVRCHDVIFEHVGYILFARLLEQSKPR